MPRPHLNPNTRLQVEENYVWLVGQARLNRADREEYWDQHAGWRVDGGMPVAAAGGYPNVQWPENRRRARDERVLDPNEAMMRGKKLDLAKIPDGPHIPRDIKLQPFKVEYDSHEQVHQKLNSTVILIKNQPAFVVQTAEDKGKFFLHVRGPGFEGIVPYDEIADCRGIAPGYFAYQGNAYWVYRAPERQNSQGMHQRNTYKRLAGSGYIDGAHPNFLLEALATAKDMTFEPNLLQLFEGNHVQSLRLNNRVALYRTDKKGAPVGVEYNSRPLGLIVRNRCKVMDELDMGPTWIAKDLARVNLELEY